MGRPKKTVTIQKKSKAGRKKKTPLTDVLEGKFCIAREHIDGHFETWTDSEEFKRLEDALPKDFESKDAALEYIEQFKDVTADFGEDALNPICVVPLKRFLAHSYSIEIQEIDGVLRPEIDISVMVKGRGTSWKDAVEEARKVYVERVTEAVDELDSFLAERITEEKILEEKASDAKAILSKIDASLKQFSAS